MRSKLWTTLALLLVLATPNVAGAQSATKFVDQVTAPLGGLILSSTAINPNTGKPTRHLWSGDQGGFGLCRVEPDLDTPGPHWMDNGTCVAFAFFSQFKPGQLAFDPVSNNIYAVDLRASTQGIFRLHYNPAGGVFSEKGHGSVDQVHMEVLGGTLGCGIPGKVPNSAVLGPDGNLYIGFKQSGDIVRIVSPTTEPLPCSNVQVIGTTADQQKSFGMGWVGHDLFGGDGRSLWLIRDADQCMTPQNGNLPCQADAILAGETAIPRAVMSDQVYPAVNGRNLFIANPSSITMVDTVTLQVTMEYAAGFQFLSGMALDPTNQFLYAADDPSNALLLQIGRWWQIGDKAVGNISNADLREITAGVTLPGGGAVLTGTGINPGAGKPFRHLWSGDGGGDGLCRVDPDLDSPGPYAVNVDTCISKVAGVQFIVGQLAYDPLLNNLYAVDSRVATEGVFRLHFIPSADGGHGLVDIVHQEILGGNSVTTGRNSLPGCGIPGNVPNSAVLGPDGSLYVGFKQSGNILRISAPETEPLPCDNVQIIGSTPDGRREFGLGWIGHDLHGADGRAGWVIPNADQCLTPANGNVACQATYSLPGYTANPAFLISDQMYPAVNGTKLYVGNPGAIHLVDPAASRVDMEYGAGFNFLSAIVFDPASRTLYGADDPSDGLLIARGHWWQVVPAPVKPALPGAPEGIKAVAGDAQATISWIPAPDGQVITSYVVRNDFASGGPTAHNVIVTAPPGSTAVPTSVVVTGLNNNVMYRFEVAAVDDAGQGPWSVPSLYVTPVHLTVPKPPTHVAAAVGDCSATVAWTSPPAYQNGGSPITSFKVEAMIDKSPAGISETVSSTIDLVVIHGLTSGVAYTFDVRATNDQGDSDPSLPSNSVTPTGSCVSAPPPANLTLTMSGPATVAAGDNAIYTLTVTNNGATAVPDVVVNDTFPSTGATLISSAPSQGTCTPATGSLSCDLGSLAAGAAASVDVTLSLAAQGVNSATVEAFDAAGNALTLLDPARANASTATAVTAPPQPPPPPTPPPTPPPGPPPTLPPPGASLVDLELTGSAQTSGTTVTMAWQITNRQSGTAMATEFVERLPQGVTLQSVSAGNGAQCITPVPDFLPQPLTCLLGDIAGGQSVSVTVVLSNPSAAALSSRALVRFIGADANYANNAWVISVPAGPSTGGTAGGGGAGGGSGSGSGGGTPPSTCGAACRVRHGIPGAARNAGPRKLSGR